MNCIENGQVCIWTQTPYCCSGHCAQLAGQPSGTCSLNGSTVPVTIDPKSIPGYHTHEGDNNGMIFLIGGVSTGILIIIIILGIIFFRMKRISQSLTYMLSQEELNEFQNGKGKSNTYINAGRVDDVEIGIVMEEAIQNSPYNKEYELKEKLVKIDFQEVLGSGEYGIVFGGYYEDTKVAVKTLKEDPEKKELKSLLSELKVLIHLHRNDHLVNIIGAQTNNIRIGKVNLIIEYCPMGSLEKYLRNERNRFFGSDKISDHVIDMYNIKDLYRWSYQIACGMEYLKMKKVIHGDLATRNILLASKHQAKISDFGLSRKIYEYNQYTKKSREPLPWRWMSIESLKQLTFTFQSDIWSLAVTIWEIFSLGDIPYPGQSWTNEFVNLLEENKIRLGKPKHLSNEMYEDILSKCSNLNPSDRPTIEEVKNYLVIKLHSL